MTENSSTITPPLSNKTNATVENPVIFNSSQRSFVTATVRRGKSVEALTRNVASFVTEDVKNVADTEISERKQESIQSEAFTHAKDADRESQQSGVTEAFTQVKDAFTGATEHLPTLRSKAGKTQVTDSARRMDEDQGNHTKSEQPSPETGSTSTAFTTTSTWLERSQETVHGESVTTPNDSETEKGQQWPIYAGVGSGSAAVAMVTAARIGYGLWRRKMAFMSNDIEMQKIP